MLDEYFGFFVDIKNKLISYRRGSWAKASLRQKLQVCTMQGSLLHACSLRWWLNVEWHAVMKQMEDLESRDFAQIVTVFSFLKDTMGYTLWLGEVPLYSLDT